MVVVVCPEGGGKESGNGHHLHALAMPRQLAVYLSPPAPRWQRWQQGSRVGLFR